MYIKKSAPFPFPVNPWQHGPWNRSFWKVCTILDIFVWMFDYIRAYYNDIKWWIATRHTCPYCNGSGREVTGEYGETWDVGQCGFCAGTGTRGYFE